MFHVFYGHQYIGAYNGGTSIQETFGSEVWNGGYIFAANHKYTKWYKGDMTPCLIEDVPKQLQMMALVLNL